MPRRAKFPPPITQCRGQARVRVAGRDHYLGRHGSPEAAAAYAALVSRLAAGLPPGTPGGGAAAPPPVTVLDLVARYAADELASYPESSREPYQFRVALAPLLRLFGGTPAADFDAPALEALQAAMGSGAWLTPAERDELLDARKPTDWSARVVNRRVIRVRTLFRWAERRKLVPSGRWHELLTVPAISERDRRFRHRPRRKPASWEDVQKVAAELPRVGRAMLLLQWWTGMRSGEVRTMLAGEVDTSGDVWVYSPAAHKMAYAGQQRHVGIGPEGRAVLAPWVDGKGPGDHVFPPSRSRGRTHYAESGYSQMVRRAAQRAGVELHPYQLRHAFKMRAERAAGAEGARAAMGHRHVSTGEHYGSVDRALAVEVARKVG